MSAIEVYLRLPSIEGYVVRKHGRSRALTPDEEDVINRAGERILAGIVAGWPVDTGTSVDAWSIHADVSPGSYGFTVDNPMHYASYVHPSGYGSSESDYWKELIQGVFDSVKGQLVLDLQAAIDRTEERITKSDGPSTGSVLDRILDVFRFPIRRRRAAA